jgi:hypothetical protein
MPPRRSRRSAPEEEEGVDSAATAAEWKMASAVKTVYIVERSRWETVSTGIASTYIPPSSYDGTPPITLCGEVVLQKAQPSVWVKLVRWCEEQSVHPESYVALIFSSFSPMRRRPPEPHQLMSEVYLRVWDENLPKLSERVRVALVVQKAAAENRFARIRVSDPKTKPEDAWVEVLVDGTLAISALFRYCLAKMIGGKRFEKIAASYEDEAVLEFQRFRKWYKLHWGALLPKGFSRFAREQYPFLLSKL